ncbi:MAG: energy transducer TonB [Algoriphagus sp.]|uniref:energy transducer TonB n=1 Tax=Algoriphagus sp. TaxID=1872435 RepID=UPI0017B40D94|nr:energy transducer TonB [Algoriphagus sp.]NVJ86503.1 energy transducer TonB [Algoriphagus sp.]
MRPIRLLILIFTASFIFSSPVLAQEAQASNGALKVWEKVLASHTRYPTADLRARKSGFIILDINFDEEGNISSYEIAETKYKEMQKSAETALENALELWKPEMLGDRNRDETYQLIFNFEMIDANTPDEAIEAATKYIYKGKPEKALKIADRLVTQKPFEPTYLELRSQINRQLGNEEAATADLLENQRLQEKTLAKIDIKVFGVVSTRVVQGTVNF